jgi:hypothetical protein
MLPYYVRTGRGVPRGDAQDAVLMRIRIQLKIFMRIQIQIRGGGPVGHPKMCIPPGKILGTPLRTGTQSDAGTA